MNIFPPTTKRVFINTLDEYNEKIRNKAIENIKSLKNCSPEVLTEKIKSLCCEWDIERMLEANAAALVLIISLVGLKSSKLFLLTGSIGFFLLLHSLQGWCPPVSLLRKAGVRTEDEIMCEKTALKMLRQDFESHDEADSEELLAIAEKE